MREPGPSLVSATWAPSADDGTARVCVTRETDDGLDVEIRRVHGAPSDDAFAARVRPGDQCEDAAFSLARPSSGVATVISLDAARVVIVGNVEAESVYHDGVPRPLRDARWRRRLLQSLRTPFVMSWRCSTEAVPHFAVGCFEPGRLGPK